MSKRIPEHEPASATTEVELRDTGDADLVAYAESKDPVVRDRLLARFGPLVWRIAVRTAARLPRHIDRADLESAGTLGLLEALDRFDPARGTFVSYASLRIRGAMLDELRAFDAMPRSYRAKRREVGQVSSQLGNRLGRRPTSSEVSSATGIPVTEVSSLRAGQAYWSCVLDEEAVEQAASYDASTTRDPEQVAMEADVRGRLLLAMDRLPDRPFRVISWYYRDGLTFDQIARRLGVTESRVTQIHAKALEQLRGQLRRS